MHSYGAVEWDDEKMPTQDSIGVVGKGMCSSIVARLVTHRQAQVVTQCRLRGVAIIQRKEKMCTCISKQIRNLFLKEVEGGVKFTLVQLKEEYFKGVY